MAERKSYYQIIRGLLVICVILIHTGSMGIKYEEDFGYPQLSYLIFRNLVGVPVPIFFFLSGYFTKSEWGGAISSK